jgi:hypothetical protein
LRTQPGVIGFSPRVLFQTYVTRPAAVAV